MARTTQKTYPSSGAVAPDEHLRAVYEAMSCAVMVVDEGGVAREANCAACHLLGVSRAELIGQTLAAVTGDSIREDGSPLPVAARPTGLALAGGRAVRDVVFGLTLRDGTRRWLQADAVPLPDADGVVHSVVTSFVDASARKRAEEELRHQLAFTAAITGSLGEGVYALDLDGRVTFMNAEAERLLGWSVEDLRGRPIHDTIHFQHADGTAFPGDECPLLNVLREGVRIEGDKDVFTRRDGALFPVAYTSAPIWAEGGRLVGAVHIFRDITAQQAMEQAMRESERHLRAVVTNAPVILFALDRDGVYTLAEGRGLVSLGRRQGDVVGQSIFDRYRDYPDILEYTRRALAGEEVMCSSRIRSAAFENRLVPIVDHNGVVTGVIGVSTDITERARAQEALAASTMELERSNADLRQFAYVASHDLQEPLRTVTSYLKLLQRRYRGKVLDETADEYMAFATDGATRMSELIRAVLDYSRVGTNGKAFAPTDCTTLVGNAVANLEARIADTGARVVYGALPVVHGDAGQLGQLFQNLIGNALKFTRPNVTPDVRLDAARQGDAWVVRVRDNGIGIAPEYAERVFQMFQRLHTRDEYEGTGIGLSTCKRIVERHGGRIWVESQAGQGATFLFTLPASDTSDAAAN